MHTQNQPSLGEMWSKSDLEGENGKECLEFMQCNGCSLPKACLLIAGTKTKPYLLLKFKVPFVS